MMTRKTKVITIQDNDAYERFRRSDYGEGRDQLMVSQEQMLFIFLVMHTLPEMKDLKHQQMMRKTEVMIQHDDTPCG